MILLKNLWLKLFSLGWQELVVGAVATLAVGTGTVLITLNELETRKPTNQATPASQQLSEQNQALPETQDAQGDSKNKTPKTTSPSPPSSSNETTTPPASSFPSPAPSPTSPLTTPPSSSTQDNCGNNVGNGNDIFAGPAGPSGGDNDRPFRSLTVHPTNSNYLIVGTERNGLLKSTDGGSTWSRLRKGIRNIINIGYPEVWDAMISSSNSSIIYAATLDSPGPVTGSYPSSMAGIYKSTDAGSTWIRINCGISNSRINSVSVAASDANQVIIGIEGGSPSFTGAPASYYNGGIFYTTDGGSNWNSATLASDGSTNGFWHMKSRSNSLFTFGMNYDDLSKNLGFLKSNDNGKNWSGFGSALKNLRIAEFDVSADGQTIYAVPRDSQQVRKSIDGGSYWTTIASNANGPIAISPGDTNLVVFATCCEVYRSTNGLTSETKIFDLNKVYDIVFAPSDNSVIWLIAEGYLLYKSTDSGASFSLVKNLRSDVLNASP